MNSKGGTLLFGVLDTARIVGQQVADSTQRDIAQEIKKIDPEPTASIEVSYINISEDKFVIAIHVNAGEHAPYTYDGRPFQRDQSETNRMLQHRYEQLLVKRGHLNYSWELIPATRYTTDDLDHDEIRLAVKQGITVGRVPETAEQESIPSILKSWGLLDGEALNNAAVVLFAKDVMPAYPQCHIKLGRFRGTSKLGDFIDNKEFYGNAFGLYAEANSFIRRHLPIASFFEPDKVERIDQPALPVFAVREALVNALCHCDYSDRSSSIAVAIFDDRMEIWNKGLLPKSNQRHQIEKLQRCFTIENILKDGGRVLRKFLIYAAKMACLSLYMSSILVELKSYLGLENPSLLHT